MPSSINTIRKDIASTNALRQYRDSIGSTAKCGYAQNWWQILMVALTYAPYPVTTAELREIVADRLGMDLSTVSTGLFIKAARGESPCRLRREYAKSLPLVALMTGLKARKSKVVGLKGKTPYAFHFKDNAKARKTLLNHFPSLDVLFALCDSKL